MNHSKVNGQTLIETLLTIVFISLTVISLIRFQNYLSYDNSLSQQTADAVNLAESKIESLRDFQVLNATSGYTDYSAMTSGSSVTTGATCVYTTTWTITSSTNPTYKTIDVTVSWTDRRGGSQSVRLVSRAAGIQPANSASVM